MDVDNLKDHLNELELVTESSFDDMARKYSQETKEKGQRRLTNQEKEELGSA